MPRMPRALLLPAVLLAACATTPRPGDAPPPMETVRIPGANGAVLSTMEIQHTTSPATHTIARPAAAVWAALPAVYAQLSIPVEEVNPQALTLGNPTLRVRRRLGDAPLSRYLDCGSTQGSFSADSYEVIMSVETHLQPEGAGSTVVTTLVDARGRPATFSAEYITCGTRGALEKRFFDLLDAQLAR